MTDVYQQILAAAPLPPRTLDAPTLDALAVGWFRACAARHRRSLTAHAVVALVLGPDASKWAALRVALERLTGDADALDGARVGEALRRQAKGRAVRVGDPGGLVAFDVDGKSAGRARWRVVPVRVPTFEDAAERRQAATARDAELIARPRAEMQDGA